MTENPAHGHWRARLHPAVHDGVARLAELVCGVFGDTVDSLVVFGSAATNSFDPSAESARSVLVLRGMDLEGLRRVACDVPGLHRQRVAPPLIMTPAYIAESLDTFPLEYLEIQQLGVLLLGTDPFASLQFDAADLRRQCEREIKVLLIALRQGLLASGGNEDDLVELDQGIAASLMRTLRGVLRLRGARDGRLQEDVVSGMEEVLGRPLEGLRRSLESQAREGWGEFVRLYEDVSAVGRWIDAFATK